MVKELFLPRGSGQVQLPRHPLTGPFLPSLHKDWQRLSVQLRRTKEVHMLRHDDIAADRPAVAIMRGPPFFDQNTGDCVRRQNCSPTKGARRDEIDRPIDPDAFEPAQMLVHLYICTSVPGMSDAGQLAF